MPATSTNKLNYWSRGAIPQPLIVQKPTYTSAVAGDSASVGPTIAATQSGSNLICIVGAKFSAGTCTNLAIADSGGNTWTKLEQALGNAAQSHPFACAFVLLNAPSITSVTITETGSLTNLGWNIQFVELAGMPSSSIDVHISALGSNSTAIASGTSGNGTGSQDLIIGAWEATPATLSAAVVNGGSPNTTLVTLGNGGVAPAVGFQLLTASALNGVSAGITSSASTNSWCAAIAISYTPVPSAAGVIPLPGVLGKVAGTGNFNYWSRAVIPQPVIIQNPTYLSAAAGDSASVSPTIKATQSGSNLIAVVGGTWSAGAAPTALSIGDSGGNTWTQLEAVAGNAAQSHPFACAFVLLNAPSITSVTITETGSLTNLAWNIQFIELGGMPSSTIDTHTHALGSNSATVASGTSANGSGSYDLVIGAWMATFGAAGTISSTLINGAGPATAIFARSAVADSSGFQMATGTALNGVSAGCTLSSSNNSWCAAIAISYTVPAAAGTIMFPAAIPFLLVAAAGGDFIPFF